MDADSLEIEDDAFPFESGALEVEEERYAEAGCFQVVDALRHVMGGDLVDALQLQDQFLFHYQIGNVVADGFAFVGDEEFSLRLNGQPAETEFLYESPFIYLFQEAWAQDV